MKTNSFKSRPFRNLCIVSYIFILSLPCAGQYNFRVLYTDSDQNLQNLEYSRSIPIGTPCGSGERITTTTIQGRKISEVDWYDGYRCGMTKIYQNNILIKEIKFYKNFILSYTSYENGAVKCHVSEDRNIFKRNGLIVQDKWQNISIAIANNKVIVLTKKEFVDLASLVVLPEEIVELLVGINNAAGDAVQSGNKNIFACGGAVKAIPGADIKTALKSSNIPTKTKAFDDINSNVNQCSANLSSANRSNYNGAGSGPSAEQARIAAATSAIDNMIAKCEAMKDDNSLVANPEDDIWNLITPALIGSPNYPLSQLSGRASEVTKIVVRGTLAEGAKRATTLAAIEAVSIPGVFILVGTGAVAFGLGTLINMGLNGLGVNDAIIDGAVNIKDKIDEAVAENDASSNSSANSDTPKGDARAKLVLPGGGQDCRRFKDLKERCDNNGWQTMECKDFVRIFSGCGNNVDPREVFINPDGDFLSGGCSNTSLNQQKDRCKGIGMVALIPPGGELVCAMNKPSNFNLLTPNPKDKWWTDPNPNPIPNSATTFLRTSFKTLFTNTKIKIFTKLTYTQFKDLSNGTTKPTLFVFLDADCPACKSFSKTLNSKEVSDAMAKNIDIVAIDAGANPELSYDLNIVGFPSFFLKKPNGTKTPMVIGASNTTDLVKYMQTP